MKFSEVFSDSFRSPDNDIPSSAFVAFVKMLDGVGSRYGYFFRAVGAMEGYGLFHIPSGLLVRVV